MRRLVLGATFLLGVANAVAGIVIVAAPSLAAHSALAFFCHLPG